MQWHPFVCTHAPHHTTPCQAWHHSCSHPTHPSMTTSCKTHDEPCKTHDSSCESHHNSYETYDKLWQTARSHWNRKGQNKWSQNFVAACHCCRSAAFSAQTSCLKRLLHPFTLFYNLLISFTIFYSKINKSNIVKSFQILSNHVLSCFIFTTILSRANDVPCVCMASMVKQCNAVASATLPGSWAAGSVGSRAPSSVSPAAVLCGSKSLAQPFALNHGATRGNISIFNSMSLHTLLGVLGHAKENNQRISRSHNQWLLQWTTAQELMHTYSIIFIWFHMHTKYY